MTRPCRLPTLFSLVLIVALYGCDDSASGDPAVGAEERTSRPPAVEVYVAEVADVPRVIRAPANISAEATVSVFPRQAGVIREVFREEGVRVEEGEVLASLDDEEWRLQERQARARLESLLEQISRARALAAQDLISPQEVDNVRADSVVATAEVGIAALRVRNANISSPISGTVTHRFVERGSQVGASDESFRIATVENLQIRVAIPERESARIQVGQHVDIIPQGEARSSGSGFVSRVRPVVDPESGTVEVTVAIAPESALRFRPGQFVTASILVDVLESRILVPRGAVLSGRSQESVFVVRDGIVHLTPIVSGVSQGDLLEISGGVAQGDTIVVTGGTNLVDGAPVRIAEIRRAPLADEAPLL